MRTSCLFVVVVVAALVCGARASDNYDYLSLNLQWPFTNGCSNDCHEIFTIHGFWPSTGTSGPSFCGGSFDPNAIDSIKDEMDYAWPSYQGENDSFWSHEYTKHGTCAKNEPGMSTEFGFFNTTLGIWYNLDIMGALAAGGISPSDTQSYKVSDMVSTINSKIGTQPVIGCEDGKVTTMAICFGKSLDVGYCPSQLTGCDSDSYVRLPRSTDTFARSA